MPTRGVGSRGDPGAKLGEEGKLAASRTDRKSIGKEMSQGNSRNEEVSLETGSCDSEGLKFAEQSDSGFSTRNKSQVKWQGRTKMYVACMLPFFFSANQKINVHNPI